MIILIIVLAIVIPTTIFAKQYYDVRYALEGTYYTVIPLDYDLTPQRDKFDNRYTSYTLPCYDADGRVRVLEFRINVDANPVHLYPPGTFVRVDASRSIVLEQLACDVSDVPQGALQKIKENYTPYSVSSLEDYASQRTKVLSARNTPSVTVSCTAGTDGASTLTYTYVYSYNAKYLAEEMAGLIEPVYLAQFRADKLVYPNLTAIFVEIKLDNGTVIYSQKFDEYIYFNYETEA